jgi:hypothetical protein
MTGWVRIYRSLGHHPIWTGERFTRGQAWVDLILLASYADHIAFPGNRPLAVKRGQVLTSQVKLAARWHWNRKTAKNYLAGLRAAGMLDFQTGKETDTGYTLITIRNYEHYQNTVQEGLDIQAAIAPAIERPSNGHPLPTIKKGKNGNTLAAEDCVSAPASRRNGKPRKTDPETDTLLKEFASAFRAKLSEPYLIEWGRDRRCMGGLVATYGVASVREKLRAFFEHGTRETRERRAWTVPEFRRVFPQLVGMKAMGDL